MTDDSGPPVADIAFFSSNAKSLAGVSQKQVLVEVCFAATSNEESLTLCYPRTNLTKMIRSWHDFHITGYVVSGKCKEIVFDLEWPYESRTDVRRAKLHFGEVQGYFLEHDLGENIVYAFSEVPLPDFLRDQTERFEANHKWA